MAEHLQRPAAFVPLSVRFLTGRTGTALLEKFGRDGPLVWAAFLAACKTHRPAGQIAYASEAEGWMILGLRGYEPDFTLEQFFAFTGRLRKTRRTRIGRVIVTENRAWARWTKAAEQEADRSRKASKRAESQPDTTRKPTRTRPGQQPDLELESESEKELSTSERSGTTHRSDLNGHTPIEKLLAWADRDIDDGGRTIRAAARGLPEVATAKVLEGIQGRRPRNRAAYVVKSLKHEREELQHVRDQARQSLNLDAEPLPGEPV